MMFAHVEEIVQTLQDDVLPGNPLETVEQILNLTIEEQAQLSDEAAPLVGGHFEALAGFKLGLCTATLIAERQHAA